MSLRERGGTARATSTRYVLRERLRSIGGESWIDDADGDRAFAIVGGAPPNAESFLLRDVAGNEVASVQQRLAHVRDSMGIERDGVELARVSKALVSPHRDRFDVELASGRQWRVQGNVRAREYDVEGDGHRVARVSKGWPQDRNAYGVEIEPSHDHALVLAVVAAVDEMRRE